MNVKKIFWFLLSVSGGDNPAVTGELIYLSQPFGLSVAPEFLGTYFVSRDEPQDADETIFLYYNNF